jgi:hypothetical protein
MALPKFQCGLQKLYANQTEFLLPSELIDNADWDLLDSDLLYNISHWSHILLIQEVIFLTGIQIFKLMILHFLLLLLLLLAPLHLIQQTLILLSQLNMSIPIIMTSFRLT